MSIYGSGLYGSGHYGLTLEEVSNLNIVNPGTGNQLNLSWSNPNPFGSEFYGGGSYGSGFFGGEFLAEGFALFYGTLVLRSTSTITDTPTNGVIYSVGNTIGSSTVVSIGSYLQNTFQNTGLTDNILYYYKVFTFTNSYSYGNGVQVAETPTDITAPLSLINFDVQDLGVANTLYISWTNPDVTDLAGIRLVRKIGSYPTSITDGTIIYDGTIISEFYDYPINNFIQYYYAGFGYDEVPLYSEPALDWAAANPLIKRFKFINDKVSDFQANVDKERTILYWEPVHRTLNFKALRVNGNSISLTATISVGDALPPYNTFAVTDAGLSTEDNKYLNDEIVFLSKYNIITRPKKITNYNGTSKVFSVEDLEYAIEPASIFGFKAVSSLIDDANIYTNSTLTAQSSAYNVATFDTITKTFTVSGSPTISAGDKFTLSTSYYPRLYTSADNGETYDDGINLTYTVENNPIPVSLEGSNYYNNFTILNSSILNTTDPNLYIGSYITFITGKNKGYSKKILNFDLDTRTVTTEYFMYDIIQSDIFTINVYTVARINDILNYVFKLVLWNNNEVNPIYSEEVITYPTLSLQNYMNALDNGYWDTSLNTNLYKIVQGIAKEGHSRAELETKLQKQDFSIKKVRELKLDQNFGVNFDLTRESNLPLANYRKRLEAVIKGFRNTSLYEGLNQLSGAFNKLPLHYEPLSSLGWRIGDDSRGGKRLGYKLEILPREVLTGDNSTLYTTFTTYTTGASGTLLDTTDYYKDSYITFTSYPSGGETFDQTLFGDFLLVDSYSSSGGIATFTLAGSGIAVNIPVGAEFLVITPNVSTAYATIPYSDVIALFGVRIYVYGPFMSSTDKAKFEQLVSKMIPAHVKKIISYETKFVGDSSHFQFEGEKTNLKNDYSINILRPIEEQLLETSRLTDTYTTSVSAVLTTITINNTQYSNFTGSNLTTKHNYYKGKSVKFLTGANIGISRVVTEYIGGTYNFITEAFPYTITSGDEFEVDKINYQTKYVTQIIDTLPDIHNVNLFDNKFVGGWFIRKNKDDIEEKIFIQFSDDMINYTTPREMSQNERLNDLKFLSTTTVTSSYSTFTTMASGNKNALIRIDDYYKNGFIKFITGTNAGEYRKILSYNASTLEFITEPFNNTIAVNNIFQLLKTDMKRFAKIIAYHNNLSEDDDIEIESLVVKIK